jgi:mannosyl-oligosaccharide alpha-1,2-mannosidase
LFHYSSWRLVPKQDHLTCFLAGSLMLGAVSANPTVPRNKISHPPRTEQLSEDGLRDWKIGSELLKTCLHTHDTATYAPTLFCPLPQMVSDWCLVAFSGLSPEIVHFRIASDGMDGMLNAPPDWYIKGARWDWHSF